jgi:hypothetical protein
LKWGVLQGPVHRTGIPSFNVPAFSTTGMNVTVDGVLVTEPEKNFIDIMTRHYVDIVVILVFGLAQQLSVCKRIGEYDCQIFISIKIVNNANEYRL